MNKLLAAVLIAVVSCAVNPPRAHAGTLTNLPWRALDTNGDPIASALLFAYEAGTSTAQSLYTDEGLTTAGTDVCDGVTYGSSSDFCIQADGNGLFSRFYCEEDTDYKFILKTSAEVTVWTLDNAACSMLTSNSVVTRFAQLTSDPITLGASANGSTDDATELQAALDAATGVVDLLGKTYRIGAALDIPSGITLRNGTLDFSQDSTGYIFISGSTNTPVALSANAAAGDRTISTGTTTNVAAGDLLMVRSDATWDGTDRAGELQEVESVTASTSITLASPLESAYTTANNAEYFEVTLKQNIVLENLKILGHATTAQTPIVIKNARNVTLRDVRVDGFVTHGIEVRLSKDVRMYGVSLRNGATGGAAIGISVSECSRDVLIDGALISYVTDGVGIKLGAPESNDGVVRNVTIRNSTIEVPGSGSTTTGAIISGAMTQYIDIVDNTLRGDTTTSSAGIRHSGADISIRNNRIYDYLDSGVALTLATTQSFEEVAVIGNKLSNFGDAATDYGIEFTNANAGSVVTSIIFSDNTFLDSSGPEEIIFVASVPVVSSLVVSGNRTSDMRIDIDGGSASSLVSALVHHNYLCSLGGTCGNIEVADPMDLSVIGNFAGSITVDSQLSASQSVNISNNPKSSGITVDCSDSAGFTAVVVQGNYVAGESPLSIAGYAENVIVNANFFDNDDDTDVTITIAGDAAGAIDQVAITGNSILDGTYGISLSNVTAGELIHDGNSFVSQATGTTTGTAFTTAGDST